MDNQGALREYSAAAALAPGNMEMVFWHAAALFNDDHLTCAV